MPKLTRGISVSVLDQLLKPTKMDASSRQLCLDDTRVDVQNQLADLLTRPSDSPHCRLIWLTGIAGSGKSALLNSVAERFRKLKQRGALIFFEQSNAATAGDVVHTLAYQLALFSPPFAEKLHDQIEKDGDTFSCPLPAQFQTLLEEPSKAVDALADHPPVIICIDGLDEFGSEESRKQLLNLISGHISKLPALFRILMASREEKDIGSSFSNINVQQVRLLIDDEATARDIKTYFQRRLVPVAGVPDWPGVIQQLTDRAGELFIWASTAVLFIECGRPKRQLQTLLESAAPGESLTKLQKLYQLINHQFENFSPQDLDDVCRVLGAIVVARERLTDDVLMRLVSLDAETMHEFLSRLRPFLEWSTGKPIGVHASFLDFLQDPTEEHWWFVDRATHHRRLATACFRIIRDDLRFNICRLESSYHKNKNIEGINERIDQHIAADLMYSCRYWADHLALGVTARSDGGDLADNVRFFLRERFLFWLEVLSLTNRIHIVPNVLSTALGWCKVRIYWACRMRSKY